MSNETTICSKECVPPQMDPRRHRHQANKQNIDKCFEK